jgi:hypothetical protein
MKLVATAFLAAIAVGYATGGRLSGFAGLKIRWPIVAVVGLALQVVPVSGKTMPLVFLWVSLLLLFAFAIANIRVGGFALIIIGIVLNFTVIAVNDGMPVTRSALTASHQGDTLAALVGNGGAKHHLATDQDRLLILGDVIPIAPLHQAVSVGDVFTYAGAMWVIVGGMRRRSRSATRELRTEVQGAG